MPSEGGYPGEEWSPSVNPWLITVAAEGLIYDHLLKQSQLVAFVQSFRLLAILSLICIPVALLLKKVKQGRPTASH